MNKTWIKQFVLDESVLTRAAVRLMARPGPIAFLMVVRDEADIIEQNINFHLQFGIQNFVITDNGSVDGTREILEEFKQQLGKRMILIDDPESAHHQAPRVNRMIQVAKQQFRPTWIIASDADEFWYPVSGRYDSEMDGRKNILECYWHNLLPRPKLSWQEFTDVGEMPGYHGGMKKNLCLARGLYGMYNGNHESRSVPRIPSRSENIRVYHYPVRSYEQFERKVVHGYRAIIKATSDLNAGWHWRAYYEAWEKGELPKVYQELASRNRVSSDTTMLEFLGKPV